MKKYLLLILMVVSTSGCTILSYQKCSKVKGHPEEKVEMTFERVSTIEHNDCTLKIHYRPHQNKSLLTGPFIPFWPTSLSGRLSYEFPCDRWIKLINTGETGIVKITRVSTKKTTVDCAISTDKGYSPIQTQKFTEALPHVLELQPNEILWINLPKKETTTISVEMNSETKEIKIKDVFRFNYHAVTV